MIHASAESSGKTLAAPYARIFARLDREKRQCLNAVENWSSEWLIDGDGKDGWSMLQVVDHLIRTERAVRQTSQQTLATSCPKITVAEQLRAVGLLLLFRTPIRVRIPPAANFVQPGSPTNLEALAQEWRKERALLFDFLASQNVSALRRTAMRHPVVGAMSLCSALRFLIVHIRHHEFQMVRLRKAVTKEF